MRCVWLLTSLFLWLAPSCLMSEPTSPCPPLTAHQAAIERREESGGSFDLARDSKYPVSIAGFRDLCLREPQAVVCAGGGSGRLTLREVTAVDVGLRTAFQYRSDLVNYGVGDRWDTSSLCDDCESYVLNLSERLHKAGQGGENMGLILWYTSRGAHATLAVETADAGTVEVSVGYGGEPTPIRWKTGVRVGVMWMDGRQLWSAVPGWPAPIVTTDTIKIPGGQG